MGVRLAFILQYNLKKKNDIFEILFTFDFVFFVSFTFFDELMMETLFSIQQHIY